jgi:iron complex outermembrane receptor protein
MAVALAFSGGLTTLCPLAAHAEETQQRYDIAAMPLEQALRQIARQSGRSIVADPALVHGRSSAAVRGEFSAEAAAQQALSGSGLALRITDNGTLTVEKVSTGDSLELNPTSIDANSTQSAFAPVPGYFASNASSASKTDKPILETAQAISVVTAQQIADRKVDRVEDAVAYSSGVRVGASGLDPRFDTISVRGFPTTESADFLDGLRQAGSGWLSLPSVEAYSLERIEVLKGPSSVLYGQISPGGMVNRVSKRPSLLAKNQVEVQGGNYDHKQGQFDIGGKLDDDGDVLFRTVGLYRDAEYSIEQMDNNARLLAPSLSWQIDPDTSLTLLAQYEERQTAGSPMTYLENGHLTNFWPGDEHFDKLDQRKWTVGYEFEHNFNDTFSFQQNLRYGELNTTNQYLDFTANADGHTFDRTAAGSYEDMSSLSTDSRLISRFATGELRHTLITGLDYAWTDTSLLYATGAAPSIDRNAPDYHQYVARPSDVWVDRDGLLFRSGVYVADQIELNQWRFSAGLRRDWVHQRSNGMEWGSEITETNQHYADTTGSVGVLYLFDNGLAPYASYATSFLPQSGSPVGGGQFAPSEGEQYEVGLKYQPPGTSALFTASLYHLTQSHVLTADPANTGFSVETGEQVSKGLELEAVADLSDNLSLNASYSFNSPEVTKSNDGNKGKDPRDVPRHLASLWLDYNLPFGLGFGAGARYTGSTYGDAMNTTKNDDYTLFDAGVHYDFSGSLDGVRLAWNARNLTDERYVNCQEGYCYRGEARSLVTSLSYSW